MGTKEIVPIKVTDRLGNLTTLDGVPCTFTVKDRTGNAKYTNQAIQGNSGMTAFCLIDTATWAAGTYRLWLKVPIGAEAPVLGPFEFEVA